ncbi:MAG TPA: hypothetical protein VMT87_10155, partial [Vicinamibacteria bacterium]|nr:hypothetical protein [Vicinamibacteria bacterium]
MAQKYKLRFADGTTLALDRDGLRTWVGKGMVDAQTTVQAPGDKKWYSLQEFLARESGGNQARGTGGGPPAEPASLKLAPIDDGPDPDQELYEGDVEGEESPFAVVWLWAKRLVVAGVLLIALGTAAAHWSVWLPWVTEHGVTLFTAIDHRVHPERARPPASAEAERERERQAALEAAAAHMPQLDAPTIERVMASGVLAILDPAEVFSRAHEAIRRGLPSLDAEAALEARALRAALQAALPAPERERLREYDRTRAHRAT